MSHDEISAEYKGWIVTLLCLSSLVFVTLSAFKKLVCFVLFLLICVHMILQLIVTTELCWQQGFYLPDVNWR